MLVAGALVLTADGASAQALRPALRAEVMAAPREPEHHVVKVAWSLLSGRQSLAGYVNFFGEDTDKRFSEVWSRTTIAGTSGLQVELNELRDGFAVVRAGYIVDVPAPPGLYLNVKLLPVTVSVLEERGFQRAAKVGSFARYTAGALQVENWVSWLLADGAAPRLLTEFTAWHPVAGPLSVEVQVARGVLSPGWVVRAGARYVAF